MKLHLGCGEKYLEEYINIDFPEGEHTVMKPRVDLTADIRTLSYPENSIDEIRSHHLFEHFSRAEALKLLTRWRSWLKSGGLLIIETPDFATSATFYLNTMSMKRKAQLARHIIGSQEAGWAMHKDLWDKQKFKFVLGKMGFEDVRIRLYHTGIAKYAEYLPHVGTYLRHVPESVRTPILNIAGSILPERFYKKYGSSKMPNILAVAKKDGTIAFDARRAAEEILAMSLTGREGNRLLAVWMNEFDTF